MIFLAHTLQEKDAFLAKAREHLPEEGIRVRFTGSHWVVTLFSMRPAVEWELQKWIRKNGTDQII